MKRRAVFLDRDGVLNRVVLRERKPYPPTSVDDVEVLPGVAEALQALRSAGFLLIVVSNQPDVARGTTSKETVEAINQYLNQELAIDRFVMCYHDSGDNCSCRKPLPGMIISTAQELDIDISNSYMIGDRWNDVEAGIAAGCTTVFIDYSYHEKQPATFDYRATSLLEAADIILNKGLLHELS